MKRRGGSRHEHDPFTDLLFNVVLGFCFLFVIAITALNPPAKRQGDIPAKAEIIITTTWADGSPDDVDTWVEAPDGEVIWFRNPDAGLMHLDRDDRGSDNDRIEIDGRSVLNPLNQEVVTIRGTVPGEYTVNVHCYHSETQRPVTAQVSVAKVNPVLQIVYYGSVELTGQDSERTAVRFTVEHDGRISGLNSLFKSLVTS
jgi:hypothetical protein